MLSSSSSQDFLMKIARGADVSETVPSGIQGVIWTFDGFREKKNESEDTIGWAIRRTEKHYDIPPGGLPPEMVMLVAFMNPKKTIVKWANGNADLYHHIFSNYLDYKYEFDGRVPVPENETIIISSSPQFSMSNMPEQMTIEAAIQPSQEPTDILVVVENLAGDTVATETMFEGLTGSANAFGNVPILGLQPGDYKYKVRAVNQFGVVETDYSQFSVYPGIGRELTAYDVPFMDGTTYYIDPSAAVNGDGLSEATPFNTWLSILNLGNSNNYLQKRGTSELLPGSGFRNINGPCFIGAYGQETEPRPIIQSVGATSNFILTNDQIIIKDMQISGQEAMTGWGVRIRGGVGSVIYNCIVNNWEQCIVTQPIGSQNGNHWAGVKVLYSTIYGANLDGIYFDDTTDIEVAHCWIYDVNMYCHVDPDEGVSAGDSIQASCSGVKLTLNVHHCTFDRLSSFNKFCIIYGDSLRTAEGTFRNNYFKMPLNSENPSHPVTGIYVDYTEMYQIFEKNYFHGGNYGIYEQIYESGLHLFQYNIFQKNNLPITFASSNGGEVRIKNNVFDSWVVGAIRPNGGPSIYVKNNVFLNGGSAHVFYSPIFSEVRESDYNHFYNSLIWSNNDPPFGTVEECHLDGYELNSTEGDPMLTDMNPEHPDYIPVQGSPLIGTGEEIAGITEDFAGNPIQLPNSKGLYDIPPIMP